MDTRKHVLDLEAFREMLHISPRIPGQSFADLPFEEEILEFLRFLGYSTQIKTLIDVVSRHQTTQQYGVILLIELTNDDIRNIKAYKKYYACATGEAAPTTTIVAAPRLSAAAKGKQPARATTPTEPTDVERTEAEQLKFVLKRSRQETHISQQRGSGTDERTGSRPGVPDVPSDDSEEELSWNSSDDEDVDEQTKGEQEVKESDEGDDEATESDRESKDEETREQEEESFDPIPRTPEDDEDNDNNEEDQGLRIGEEERMQEEEDAKELYCDVDINQGRGLQVSQETEYFHVILTPTQSDAQQEISSTSSFMTNLLNPITVLDRGSKRQREGGEYASASTPSEPATGKEPVQTTCQMEEPSHPVFETGAVDQPIIQTTQHPEWFSQPKRPPTPDRDWNKSVPAAQGEAQLWIRALAKQTDARFSFNELLDTPIDFSNFIMNRLGQFYGFAVNRESALDVYSKRRIIAVTELKIVEWHTYKHLDWISVRHDDDKIYKFKEGDLKRLRIQDIEDMLLLLVQGKLSNLTVKEHFAFNVSLRMFTRSIVIQRPYTAHSNPRGFIYQNKDKKNRLMRIDELHKFSDGTLNDVHNALDDCLKGIQMQYLPTTIWRRGDKARAATMIQAIDKMLKTRRIMRSLERFVGG
nr:hypothetical protein [Tanacetum cinerariifolium]